MDSYSFQNKPLYYSYHQGFLSKTPLTLVKTIHRFMVSHEQTLNPDYEKSLHPAVGPVRSAVHLFACLPGSCQAKRRLTRPPPRSSALASSSSLFPRSVVLCRSPALLYRLVPCSCTWRALFLMLRTCLPASPAWRNAGPGEKVARPAVSLNTRFRVSWGLCLTFGQGRDGQVHFIWTW
jgi:hypothetical protein